MTLFIACLVIYQSNLPPWLYAVAALAWGCELLVRWLVVNDFRDWAKLFAADFQNVFNDMAKKSNYTKLRRSQPTSCPGLTGASSP